MKYRIACLLLVGSTLVPHWHLTFLHGDFCLALTWAVIRCRKQRKLSENQFAECKEYKPTLAYKCECRQTSLTLPNVGNICIHWIPWGFKKDSQDFSARVPFDQGSCDICIVSKWASGSRQTFRVYKFILYTYLLFEILNTWIVKCKGKGYI